MQGGAEVNTPKSTPRDRMLTKSREYQIGTYVNKFVAKDFQRMIRAEAGAQPAGPTVAVFEGRVTTIMRQRGQCVCVTCGKRDAWSGNIGGMHTGHFLASRCFSILFEEDNVAPQCSGCNRYHSGRPEQFRMWMEHVRGVEVIDRLQALKATTRHFKRDELVEMRIEYKRRLKDAEEEIRTRR